VRFFYLHGLSFLAYLVPDPETEQRLIRKHVWLLRVWFPLLLLELVCLLVLIPGVWRNPAWWFVEAWVGFVLTGVVEFFYFRAELRKLCRVPARLALLVSHEHLAKHHSEEDLRNARNCCRWMMLMGVVGLWVWDNPLAIVCYALSICRLGLSWNYALRLKRETVDSPPGSGNPTLTSGQ
jgi:hypothetical protein